MNWKNVYPFILILIILILGISIIKIKYNDKQEDNLQSTLPEAVKYLYGGQVESISYGQPWEHKARVYLKNGQSIETSDKIGYHFRECRKLYSYCEEVAQAMP